MGVWGRVLVALVMPVAWGLVTAWLFDWLRQRRERNTVGAATTEPATDACSEDEVATEPPR
jgi:hypothetical protein